MLPQSTTTGTAGTTLSPAKLHQVRKQAQELEGVFLNTLMKQMFASVHTDRNAMGGGFGESTWRDMQAEQLANSVAEAGGIGLADALMPDLLAAQEAAQNSNFHSFNGPTAR